MSFWGAIGSAAGNIIGNIWGSYIQAEGAEDAANIQANSSNYAADAQIEAAGISAGAIVAAGNASANATRYAADRAANAQLEMYYQSREDQLPWLEAGVGALSELEKRMYAGPGEFEQSPGYQFRLEQGNDNILSNASATGNLASGRTLKALQEYGQDYASNEYDKFLNRYYQSLSPWQSMAGLGQSTATSLGNSAIQTGAGLASTYNNMGNSLASIYSSQGSNLASIYGSTGNAIAANYMNQGNIAANNAYNQSNIWGNTVSNSFGALGELFSNWNSGGDTSFGSSGWWSSGSGGGNGMQYMT